jgi:hypothetical protein
MDLLSIHAYTVRRTLPCTGSTRSRAQTEKCKRATGREQKPHGHLERLVEALLEPVARRARQQALGLMQTV